MKCFKGYVFLFMVTVILVGNSTGNELPQPTVTRTEIRVAKSLDPEDTQTLNVMTKDGNVAQLIVKRRDPKSKLTSPTSTSQIVPNDNQKEEMAKSYYSNWIPVKSVYLPNLIRLETFTLVNNASEEKSIKNNNIGSVSSDRIPHVPKPVTIRSGEIYIKPTNDRSKNRRSLLEIDSDGIPIVHGVRVPDDETDENVWRNARVINGELVPYEKGYKPPAAVPIGQLVYASKIPKDSEKSLGVGPFSTSDNYQKSNKRIQTPFGPFSVKDNKAQFQGNGRDYIKFSGSGGGGRSPYTVSDSSRSSNSQLYDYIKEVNAQESKRDYSVRRKYRSYDSEDAPQIQRRMLHYGGVSNYPDSMFYSSPSTKLSHVNFNEGVRTPILQYAHPELGVQPAKASNEVDNVNNDYNPNEINNNFAMDTNYYEDLSVGGRYSQTPYYVNNLHDVDYYKKDDGYPNNAYYVNQKTNQPFWIRLTESIKDNVQSSFEKMHQMTRPVFDPIVEATQKITHTLGLMPHSQSVQEKVGLITPIGSSIILPALGLVAGGAALGLGAAAVGRFLQPENMRAIHGMSFPNDILLIMEQANNHQRELREHRRLRRSLQSVANQYLQESPLGEQGDDLEYLSAPYLWTDTPCAKKIFCNVMVRQSPDDVVIMEKKMDAMMSKVHPAIIKNVSRHLQEVLDAIKKTDCSKFVCRKKLSIPVL